MVVFAPAKCARSIALAQNLKLPIHTERPASGFALQYLSSGLSLWNLEDPRLTPLSVDFTTGKTQYRKYQSELIVKATAIGKLASPKVLDATAGLGQDAFVLARHHCDVTLLERNPVIAALLRDGIYRAQLNPDTSAIAARMSLIRADANEWLLSNTAQFDCIYLDPMFPERKKQAAVKKEMQIFQTLLGENTDTGETLLALALRSNCPRVVVKRPAKAAALCRKSPSFTVKGRSTRFDVYLNPQSLSGRGHSSS